MKKVLTCIILLISLSCTDKSKAIDLANSTSETKLNCGEFLGFGQIVESSYTFCSIVPVVNEYTYKRGTWKFWDKKGTFVTEVEFSNKLETITGHGGCNYYVMLDTIVSSSIELSKEVKKSLENCNCHPN